MKLAISNLLGYHNLALTINGSVYFIGVGRWNKPKHQQGTGVMLGPFLAGHSVIRKRTG